MSISGGFFARGGQRNDEQDTGTGADPGAEPDASVSVDLANGTIVVGAPALPPPSEPAVAPGLSRESGDEHEDSDDSARALGAGALLGTAAFAGASVPGHLGVPLDDDQDQQGQFFGLDTPGFDA